MSHVITTTLLSFERFTRVPSVIKHFLFKSVVHCPKLDHTLFLYCRQNNYYYLFGQFQTVYRNMAGL